MPSLINRIPNGLLSLLGIKSVGQNPSLLSDTVSPTLDLSAFYFTETASFLGGTTNTANLVGAWAPSNWTNTTQTETWVVNTVCSWRSAGLPAATAYKLRLGVYDTLTGFVYASGPQASYVAGDLPAVGWCSQQGSPILLRPNQSIAVLVEGVTLGTAVTFDVYGFVTRLIR